MRYKQFEYIFSEDRMRKYVTACNGDTRRAMTLYRYNVKLSQEMFAVISCFEVALRNAIVRQMKPLYGNDWLRDFVLPGGNFYINNVRNRIAHHEPICFGRPICIDTTYALNNYARMMKLFQWMGLDSSALLYGLDNVGKI